MPCNGSNKHAPVIAEIDVSTFFHSALLCAFVELPGTVCEPLDLPWKNGLRCFGLTSAERFLPGNQGILLK